MASINNGSIYNKPTQAGLVSLFVKEDSVEKDVKDQQNDYNSSFEENVETPKKDLPHVSQLLPRVQLPPEKSILGDQQNESFLCFLDAIEIFFKIHQTPYLSLRALNRHQISPYSPLLRN